MLHTITWYHTQYMWFFFFVALERFYLFISRIISKFDLNGHFITTFKCQLLWVVIIISCDFCETVSTIRQTKCLSLLYKMRKICLGNARQTVFSVFFFYFFFKYKKRADILVCNQIIRSDTLFYAKCNMTLIIEWYVFVCLYETNWKEQNGNNNNKWFLLWWSCVDFWCKTALIPMNVEH